MTSKCVSVIMPIYNCENELNRSISSVLDQTYSNIQLILIDDGSTDNSYKICDAYRQKDSRIELHKKENSGVSSGRNDGLDYAKGEYVTFLDADDEMKPVAIETMVNSMEKTESDMVVCSYYKEFRRNLHIPVERLDKSGKYTAKEYLCNTLKDPGHHYYGVVWNKIYRNEIIRKHNIRFDTNVNLGEDFIFNLEYISNVSSVCVIKDRLVNYSKSKSKTLSQNKSKQVSDCQWEFINRKKIYDRYVNTFKMFGVYNQFIEEINFYWVIFYVRQVHDANKEYRWDDIQKSKWLDFVENDPYIRQSLSVVPNRKINRYRRWYSLNYAVKKMAKKLGGIK